MMPYGFVVCDVSLGNGVAVGKERFVGTGGAVLVVSGTDVAELPHAERINVATVNIISKFFFILC